MRAYALRAICYNIIFYFVYGPSRMLDEGLGAFASTMLDEGLGAFASMLDEGMGALASTMLDEGLGAFASTMLDEARFSGR